MKKLLPQVDLIDYTTYAFISLPNRFKSTFLVCLTIITFTQGYAQNWQWGRKGVGGNGKGVQCATDMSGNIVVAGMVSSTVTFGPTSLTVPGGLRTAVIVKYDANGTFLWAHQTTNGTAIPVGVTCDRNNNSYLFGIFDTVVKIGSTILSNSSSSPRMSFLAKYDPLGNLLWAKKISGAMAYYTRFPGGITTDSLGNIYLSESFNTSPITVGSYTLTPGPGTHVMLAKLDSSGNPSWATYASGFMAAASGGLAVSSSGNIYLGYDDSYNAYINKYNNSGTLLWADTATCTFSYAAGIAADRNDNAYLVGMYDGPSITFGGTTLPNLTENSGYIVQYSPSGSINWTKKIISQGTNQSKGSICSGVTTDTFNNVWVSIATGQSDTVELTPTDIVLPIPASNAPLIIAGYNSTGAFLESATLQSGYKGPYAFGGISTNRAGNIFVCGDFNLVNVVAGPDTLTPPVMSGVREILVAKYRPTHVLPVAVSDVPYRKEMVLYPNPASSSLTISCRTPGANDGVVSICDLLGKELHRYFLKSEDLTIPVNDLLPGLYVCRMITTSGALFNAQLVIIR